MMPSTPARGPPSRYTLEPTRRNGYGCAASPERRMALTASISSSSMGMGVLPAPMIPITPGVIGIIGAGKTPIPIDDEEIEAVRAILRSGLAAQPYPFLRVGSRVDLEGGPLAGVEGIITNADKVYRLVVSISLLQRSVAVAIDRDWARPIADDMGPRAVTMSERMRLLACAC